jgi:preprotein translocase subunit SecD
VRRFKGYWSLIVIIGLAIASLVYTFVADNKPLLGLDLQGGVSVVLEPTGDVESDTIDEAISIIRQRVDAIGVAEPEITRQGDNILIQIPGVEDQDRALELVGQTAELQFRPVLASFDPSIVTGTTDTTDTTAADATDTTAADGTESTATTAAEGTDTTATTAPTDGATTTTVPVNITGLSPDVCTTGLTADQLPEDAPAYVPMCEGGELVAVYQVGPVALKGDSLETARATLDGQSSQWTVNPVFKGGDQGIGLFNAIAAQCFQGTPGVCPATAAGPGQLAIVLDGRVISAPTINTASFSADDISISGTFTEGEAKDLATSLRYGALPVELEQQQAQIVSATLGRDALEAGLVAGAVGLGLVALYMIAFYRFLGFLAIVKLAVEGALLWSIISYLGTSNGLALTLAGITGIIVSIGVSVDSNVVYYEHLKEDVLNGRMIRSATDRAFTTSFSTIVKAGVASLIGAGLLWWLTVGPVRGFAFYLGLATLLDLLASWAYMRPAVKLATRSNALLRRPRLLGLPAETVQHAGPGRTARTTTGASR